MATDKYSKSKSETGYNYTIRKVHPWFGKDYTEYSTNEGGGYDFRQDKDGNFYMFDDHSGDYKLVSDDMVEYLTNRVNTLNKNSDNANTNFLGLFIPKSWMKKSNFINKLSHLKNGGNMNYSRYLLNGGYTNNEPATIQEEGSEQDQMMQQLIQLVLAAMQGDQLAAAQIQQIALAAQQGDQQATQIMQMIQQIMQELQSGASSMKDGGAFEYISSLKCGKKIEKKAPAKKKLSVGGICPCKAKLHKVGGKLTTIYVDCNGNIVSAKKGTKIQKGEIGLKTDDDWKANANLLRSDYNQHSKTGSGTNEDVHYYLGNDGKWYKQSVTNGTWSNSKSDVNFNDEDFTLWRRAGHNIFVDGFTYDPNKENGKFDTQENAIAALGKDTYNNGTEEDNMTKIGGAKFGTAGNKYLGTTSTAGEFTMDDYIKQVGLQHALDFSRGNRAANRAILRLTRKELYKPGNYSSEGRAALTNLYHSMRTKNKSWRDFNKEAFVVNANQLNPGNITTTVSSLAKTPSITRNPDTSTPGYTGTTSSTTSLGLMTSSPLVKKTKNGG